MEQLNGAQVLVKSLEDLGIKRIFGYTGGAIHPVFNALEHSNIDITVNSNEQSCAFSAAGYSRSSDQVGVTIVTSGPAITNTLTSVADAYGDNIPLIVIAGQVPEHKLGTDSFQHIDVGKTFRAATKKVIQLKNGDNIENIIKDAYYFAKSGKPGPVVIDFPLNKQEKIHEYNHRNINDFEEIYTDEKHLNEGQCEQFFELLTSSKKPLLYLGGGLNSIKGSKAVHRFKEHFQIPSVNTLMAKGVDNEKEDLNLGMLGMFGTPYANKIIQENDFFFALGARWDDRVAEKVGFAIDAKIAYVDINPKKMREIKINRSPEFTFIGDAASALNNLVDYAQKKNITIDIKDWQEQTKTTKKEWPLNYNKSTEHIQSAEVIEMLATHINADTKITTGVGNHQMLAAQYIQMEKPKSFMTSGSYGTMGFGIPTAIGVQYAHPNSTVVAIDGDGGLKMNLGELHTISESNLPIKILVVNNHSEQMVSNLQDICYENERTASTRTNDVNFAKVADSFGFNYSKRVTKRNELEIEMEKFLKADGPSFLEVITDTNEVIYPKVTPGTRYKDMELGPYIKKVTL